MTLTYDGVGTSIERSDSERRAVLGSGRACFERASSDNLRWQIKIRAGFRVDADVVELDRDYVITIGPVREEVRVVRMLAEPRRTGFAYGTLPRHPLIGEEAFLIEWNADDTVELVIRSFSRPNGLWWTLLLPLVALARQLVLRRYLRALVN